MTNDTCRAARPTRTQAARLRASGLAAGLALALALPFAAQAQEAAIRKNLPERLPNLPKIDEVSKTAVPGIWEVRIGTDLFYTDDQGNHLFTGELIDTRTRANLSRERIDKLTAFDFSKLPLKDAIVIKQGTGARKMAVFVDPNCGYCKRFERDVAGQGLARLDGVEHRPP